MNHPHMPALMVIASQMSILFFNFVVRDTVLSMPFRIIVIMCNIDVASIKFGAEFML